MRTYNTSFLNLADIGKRIKKIRSEFNCTMEQFARMTGTKTKASVNNWEKGTRLPTQDSLELIAILGKTTPEQLLFGDLESFLLTITNKNSNVYKTIKKRASLNQGYLFDFYEGLGDEDQKRIINLYLKHINKRGLTLKDVQHLPDEFIIILGNSYELEKNFSTPDFRVLEAIKFVDSMQFNKKELQSLELMIHRKIKGDDAM